MRLLCETFRVSLITLFCWYMYSQNQICSLFGQDLRLYLSLVFEVIIYCEVVLRLFCFRPRTASRFRLH